MNLDLIKNNTKWEDAAAAINSNFNKANLEIAKVSSASVKHKGFFTTEAALLTAQPSPRVGDNAYVGATYPGVVYVCNTAGVWTATTTVPSPPAVDIAEYYKKTETDTLVNGVSGEVDTLRAELEYEISGSEEKDPAVIAIKEKVIRVMEGYAGYFYTRAGYKSIVYDLTDLKGRKITISPVYTGANQWIFYAFVHDYASVIETASQSDTEIAAWNSNLIQKQNGGKSPSLLNVPDVDGNVYIVITVASDTDSALVLNNKKTEKGLIQRVEILESGEHDISNVVPSTSNSLAVREIVKGFKNEDGESYYLKDNAMNAVSFDDNAYLDTKIREIPAEANSFVWVTDTHWYPTSGADGDEGSARKSNYLINYIKQRANLGKVIFGGDCFNVAENKYKAAAMLSGYADEFFSSFGNDGVWCIGNHDPNSAAREADNLDAVIPDTEVYKRTVGLMNQKDVVYDTRLMRNLDAAIEDGSISLSKYDEDNLRAWIKMHYYVDDKANKTRYIVVESNDEGYATTSVLGVTGFSATPWLCLDFVADSLISLPNGYNVVLVAHSMYHQAAYSYGPSNIFLDIAKILSYFKTKRDMDYSGITLAGIPTILWRKELGDKHYYNFSECENTPNKVFMMFGHTHWDAAWICQSRDLDGTFCRTRPSGYGCAPYTDNLTQDEDAILCFTSNSDSWRLNNKTTTCPNGTACGNEMELGTITEHSFEIVSMLPEKVVLTKVGAGQSRAFMF